MKRNQEDMKKELTRNVAAGQKEMKRQFESLEGVIEKKLTSMGGGIYRIEKKFSNYRRKCKI